MSSQDELRGRLEALILGRTAPAAAQAIIDEFGLTVEAGGGYGYGRAPDLKFRPVESRVVGKWEKQ